MAKSKKQDDAETTAATDAADAAPAAKPVTFYSKHPGYRIFDAVQFVNGRAVVDDPAMVERMRADREFGIAFWADPA